MSSLMDEINIRFIFFYSSQKLSSTDLISHISGIQYSVTDMDSYQNSSRCHYFGWFKKIDAVLYMGGNNLFDQCGDACENCRINKLCVLTFWGGGWWLFLSFLLHNIYTHTENLCLIIIFHSREWELRDKVSKMCFHNKNDAEKRKSY